MRIARKIKVLESIIRIIASEFSIRVANGFAQVEPLMHEPIAHPTEKLRIRERNDNIALRVLALSVREASNISRKTNTFITRISTSA